VALAITILISWYLFRLASGLLANNDTTQIWEIDLWPFGFVMAAASILMVTAIMFHILISLRVATGRRDPSNYVKSLAPGK
jgi:TRAP-type C4-dicarboxylate transport system permease small subunit